VRNQKDESSYDDSKMINEMISLRTVNAEAGNKQEPNKSCSGDVLRALQVTSPWRLLSAFSSRSISARPRLPPFPFPSLHSIQAMTAVLSPSNPLRKDNIMATLDGDLIG